MRTKKDDNNKTYLIITFFILLTAFFFFSGFTADSDGGDTLILLGNKNLAPIVYDENGTAKGVAVDIAKAIGNELGYDIKVLATDWEQAQIMVLRGEADGLLQINPSPERNELYDFSGPLLKSEFSMFVLSDNVTLKSIDDLRGKNVGIEASGYPSILLQEYEGINTKLFMIGEHHSES